MRALRIKLGIPGVQGGSDEPSAADSVNVQSGDAGATVSSNEAAVQDGGGRRLPSSNQRGQRNTKPGSERDKMLPSISLEDVLGEEGEQESLLWQISPVHESKTDITDPKSTAVSGTESDNVAVLTDSGDNRSNEKEDARFLKELEDDSEEGDATWERLEEGDAKEGQGTRSDSNRESGLNKPEDGVAEAAGLAGGVVVGSIARSSSCSTTESSESTVTSSLKEEADGLVSEPQVPEVAQVPYEMWSEMVNAATTAFEESCAGNAGTGSLTTSLFEELSKLFGGMQLGPRADLDVVSGQLLKDIKRETIQVNDEIFVGASNFDALYSALEQLLKAHSPDLSGTPLEHKVQRIFRGCSRTVSGYDAYDIISGLFAETRDPKALVTPAMMNNSPIRIESKDGNKTLTVTSVNVFKINRELEDGSPATVVVMKTEVAEQIELDSWQTVRWMTIKPLDKAEECVNPVVLFKDRALASILEISQVGDEQLNKKLVDLLGNHRAALDQAIEQTIRAIKQLAESEYNRGAQDSAKRLALEPSRDRSHSAPGDRSKSPSPDDDNKSSPASATAIATGNKALNFFASIGRRET